MTRELKSIGLLMLVAFAPSWAVRVFPDSANRTTPASPDRPVNSSLWTASGKLLIISPAQGAQQFFLSGDRGATWSKIQPQYSDPAVAVGGTNLINNSIVKGKSGALFAGISGMVYVTGSGFVTLHGTASSTDDGATWKIVDTNSLGQAPLAGPKGELFAWRAAPARAMGFYRSGDNGATWDSLPPMGYMKGAIGNDGTIYLSAFGFLPGQNVGWSYAFRSTDNGTTWKSLGRLDLVTQISVDGKGNALFGMGNASYAYAALTEDSTHIAVLPPHNGNSTYAVAIDESGNWFAAVEYRGIYFSQDKGTTWTSRSGGVDTLSSSGHFNLGPDGTIHFSSQKGLYYIEGTGTSRALFRPPGRKALTRPGWELLGNAIGLRIPDSGPDAYREIRGRYVPGGFPGIHSYR